MTISNYSILIGIHASQLTLVSFDHLTCKTVTAIDFGLNWNRCPLQQSLFIQYVKTEKYTNIESLKKLAIDRCTYKI